MTQDHDALLERLEDGPPWVRGYEGMAIDIDAAAALQHEAAALIRKLTAELERQCDNMAFVLNRVDVGSWHDKFDRELSEARSLIQSDEGR